MSTSTETITEAITEAEVRQLAEEFYEHLASHVSVDRFYPLLAEHGLVMKHPNADLHGREGFAQWYDQTTHRFFDESHTVTAVKIADATSEPLVVLGLEILAAHGIAAVGVEASRDDQEVGLEADQVVERTRERVPVDVSGRPRDDRVVEAVGPAVLEAGVGEARRAVDGGVGIAGPIDEDVLGAVAVVDVEVEDGDALAAPATRGERGE